MNELEKFPVDSVLQIRKSAIYVYDEEGNLTDQIKGNKRIVWFENECVEDVTWICQMFRYWSNFFF